MFPKTVAALLITALGLFAYSVFRWVKIFQAGKPDHRFEERPEQGPATGFLPERSEDRAGGRSGQLLSADRV